MKIVKVIPILLVFTIISIVSVTPNIFADHPEVTIETASSSGVPGCEDTDEGCYIPSIVVVDVGGDVIMTNTDSAMHTFTAGIVENSVGTSSGIFDSGFLSPGDSFEYSPDVTGEIPYYCMLHTWMVGTITVQGESVEEEHVEDKTMETQTIVEEGLMTDINQIMAEIITSDSISNEPMTINLTLTDLDGNGIEHITYNIQATQDSEVILDEQGHMHKGILTNSHTTSALSTDASDSMPVVIIIESVGFGHDDQYVDVSGEIATKQIVPEFGTIVMMILVIAIISIVTVTTKSRVIPRF